VSTLRHFTSRAQRTPACGHRHGYDPAGNGGRDDEGLRGGGEPAAAGAAPPGPAVHADGRDALREVTEAKLLSQRSAYEVADDALQIHGGAGYMREYEIERVVRDTRLGPIGGGTDEVMREILGKQLGL
jgi:alkylation response protein AidB-like acyl-CoA dehydrogenase